MQTPLLELSLENVPSWHFIHTWSCVWLPESQMFLLKKTEPQKKGKIIKLNMKPDKKKQKTLYLLSKPLLLPHRPCVPHRLYRLCWSSGSLVYIYIRIFWFWSCGLEPQSFYLKGEGSPLAAWTISQEMLWKVTRSYLGHSRTEVYSSSHWCVHLDIHHPHNFHKQVWYKYRGLSFWSLQHKFYSGVSFFLKVFG